MYKCLTLERDLRDTQKLWLSIAEITQTNKNWYNFRCLTNRQLAVLYKYSEFAGVFLYLCVVNKNTETVLIKHKDCIQNMRLKMCFILNNSCKYFFGRYFEKKKNNNFNFE